MGSWTLPKVEGLAPAPRGGMACTSLGSTLLVFGGADRTPIAYDDLWLLDLGKCRREFAPWLTCEGVAVKARAGATLTAIGDEVYLFGGQDPLTGIAFNDLLVLDTRKWQWSRAELVFGGAGMQGTLGDTWVYNPATQAWAQFEASGKVPQAREMHTGVMVSPNRLLVYGGRGADGRVLGDICVLDVKLAEWVEHKSTKYERCAHSAVALGGTAAEEAAEASVDGSAAAAVSTDPPPEQPTASAAPTTSATASAAPEAQAEAPASACPDLQAPCEPFSRPASGTNQHGHPQQRQQQQQQQHQQHVLVYGGFSGTQVEGTLLSIDVHTLEVTKVADAATASGHAGAVACQGKSNIDPSERFAHCAAAITLPLQKGSSGRHQAMVVFGGVNPAEDLNSVAVWQDSSVVNKLQGPEAAAQCAGLIKALHVTH